MKTQMIYPENSIELSTYDLTQTNGGFSPWDLLIKWGEYLYENRDSLKDGLVDGWNELYGTITN